MKTTMTIKALAYPVKLKDHRTGKLLEDTIVLLREWLQICGSNGLDICDDKHMIYRAYNVKGYEVLEIGKRNKVQFTVDLSQIYRDHIAQECNELMQTMLQEAEEQETTGEDKPIVDGFDRCFYAVLCEEHLNGISVLGMLYR